MNDLKFAFRQLIRNPGFAAVAILTLALGIGVNCAIFSVVRAVLLKPLPYPEAERLVFAWNKYSNNEMPKCAVAIPDYLDRRADVPAFAESALFAGASFSATEGGTPERLRGLRVTPSFFPLYGIAPMLGQTFTDAEAEPGNEHVVVLSHGLWKAKYGADPAIVGRDIRLNGETYRVKGVMPERFLSPGREPALWVPFAFTSKQRTDDERGQEFSTMVARLKPGATIAQAQAQVDAINKRNLERLPDRRNFMETAGFGGLVVGYLDDVVGKVRPMLLLLQGAVVLVLFIACANVANLLLVRAGARSREIAVRTAIGASRWQITRLLLAESLLIAIVAGAVGVFFGWVGVRLLGSLGISEIPRAQEIAVDSGVIVFSLLLSSATGIIFGLAPLFAIFRGSLVSSIKEGAHASSGRSMSSLRSGLIIAEVALAFVLLTAAALLYRSFAKVQEVDLGFRPENVLTAQISLPASRYSDDPSVGQFFTRLTEKIRALPGVTAAGVISDLPLNGSPGGASYSIKDFPRSPGEATPHAQVMSVDSGYFAATKIQILRGRAITDADVAGAPQVVVIDQFLAQRYFKGLDPLGRQINFGDETKPDLYDIVGVAGDAHFTGPAEPVLQETLYFSQAQLPARTMGVVIKTALDPQTLVSALRNAVQQIDPEQPIFDVKTMDQRLIQTLQTRRAAMVLVVAFGIGSLLLASIGLYGVLAYSVTQRIREIGIRVALGAQASDVTGMILRQGLRLAGLGIMAGLVLALALAGSITHLLFGIPPRDPLTWLIIAAVLCVAALLASFIPALRAARVNPMVSLRTN